MEKHTYIDAGGIAPGARCQVVSVHHAAFASRIGRVIVIVEVIPELGLVWGHDDSPVTYRINRLGRRVIDSDPRCLQTLHSINHLRLERGCL